MAADDFQAVVHEVSDALSRKGIEAEPVDSYGAPEVTGRPSDPYESGIWQPQ